MALPCWVTFRDSVAAGERVSTVLCQGTFALWLIAAAAPGSEEPRGRTGVIFCTCTCWGALVVAAGWHLALGVEALFPSPLLPRF